MEQTLILPSAATSAPANAVPVERARPARLEAVWARHEDEVAQAQRLRHRVFVQEMGARLRPAPGTPEGHDADLFDRYCEHLLVRTQATADASAQVVGTYRVLTPEGARLAGGLYSDLEFDLVRLRPLRRHMAELGRSCIDPRWRSGSVILLLWSALAAFMQRNGFQHMVGCASISMRDGGHAAASLWQQLRRTHLAPVDLQVRPRLPLPLESLRSDLAVEAPPLIRGYLRCGARVLGAPAWDPDFNTADLPLMLRLRDLPAAYSRHFGA
ncbi:GNAT family N-acetyltransferase [Azohydromonas caseinilytica]|uniref:L-ornithine N(alpha)-acyltransferase n=1 Tax=Azohydromonas caseinilytica TaxID=2728836 RepID=A0A848FGB6_9BURK|nr:GNAT family N-acyltransferase [Azohydromonas caseinilytica]NML18302.1 GNAT family N-acetyltransferase [Azohydromonas caseinilytica]